MWPFKRKPKPRVQLVDSQKLLYSQVDVTEAFDDDTRLGADEWIDTVPLNSMNDDPESMGLPPVGASADRIHAVASRLSALRESVEMPGDGVYCPICHIANTQLNRLRTPCPKCGRKLLQFGWT